ncbi:MAG: hypothetical protein AABY03_01355, partial [Nanoarchaeota archaeon]
IPQYKMNRRGDISITLLVLGVFAVCTLTLFSFYISGVDGKETALKIGIMEKINSLAEEIKFYKNPEIGKDPKEVMEIFDKGITDGNILFTRINNGDNYKINAEYSERDFELFGFGLGERKVLFSVEYIFVP